jgi:hypothetical protein
MTRRGWWLVASAYVIGAIGLAIAFAIISRQNDRLERENERLQLVTAGLCQAIGVEELLEDVVLVQLANHETVRISAVCQKIAERVEKSG